MVQKQILGQPNRKKLLSYATLLEEIAKENSRIELEDSHESKGEFLSRAELFESKRAKEERQVLSKFVLDTAEQLKDIAYDSEEKIEENKWDKQEKKLARQLRAEGIEVLSVYKGQNRNGYLQVTLECQAKEDVFYDAFDIAELVSECFRQEMLPLEDGNRYVHNAPTHIVFQQEPELTIYAGFARATREGEEVSGDNYLLREFGDGTYLAGIADGMGSGMQACADSERTLNLLENYVESGLPVKSCIEICNELFYLKKDLERTASLDLLELNEYTGECHIYKNGAPDSYLIRHKIMHKLRKDTQPLGIKPQPSGYDELLYLQHGDLLIMASDGVMDLFYEKEEELLKGIESLCRKNLTDIASGLLSLALCESGGVIEDDMTILILQVCQKEDNSCKF